MSPERRRLRLNRILARDAWTCQICYGPIDPDVTPNTDWSPSVDHVRPRSEGGPSSDENLRAAHRCCNSARNDGHQPQRRTRQRASNWVSIFALGRSPIEMIEGAFAS